LRNWIIVIVVVIVAMLGAVYIRSLPSAQGQNNAGTASSASDANASGSTMPSADPSRITSTPE
jgi:hypothetical protein